VIHHDPKYALIKINCEQSQIESPAVGKKKVETSNISTFVHKNFVA